MQLSSDLRSRIQQSAQTHGFALCDIAAVPAPGTPEDTAERAYFAEWIAQGRSGEMGYLARADEQGTLLRSSLRVALPWAESVIVCAVDYSATAPFSIDPAPANAGWIARYAWSGDAASSQSGGATRGEEHVLPPTDYHDVILKNLRTVEAALLEHCSEEEIQTRCYVDTGPIVERTFARYAGIGWVGKNACILNQQRGSWLFLGVIVTSLRLPQELTVVAAADRCGSCTRCIDACPTDALVAPRQMDASLCIAYLTIEKKGSIAEELRPLMGRQVFGCDICQDVCPWNQKQVISRDNVASKSSTSPEDAVDITVENIDTVILREAKNLTKPVAPQIPKAVALHAPAEMQPRSELINPSLHWLAALDNPAFKKLFRGSPLERTKLKGLRRNVAIAMANSGDASYLPQLEQWSQSEDEILRETATWAMARLGMN